MKKRILVTGAAGFIGFHVSTALQKAGAEVIGIDHFNDYYSVDLKRSRQNQLQLIDVPIFEIDLGDRAALETLFESYDFTHVINLAAQAGVRYAEKNPDAYMQSNLIGFLNLLEVLKQKPQIKLVYASSSSVYGTNESIPFSIQDRTDQPANLYAATKKANELLSYSYHHLYGLTAIGLRYFTVYGPWGRPDMAYYHFTESILADRPIRLFNNGQMWRDFTYIDDAVSGTLAALDYDQPAVFNIGNHQSEELLYFVSILEKELGKKAKIELVKEAKGEMIRTYADLCESHDKLGYKPVVCLEEGLKRFIHWHKAYASGRASIMSEAISE